jgi:Reverse transcriptase (RNA-dependent DNA polymerase)
MIGRRQNTQRELARELSERGEPPIAGDPGIEPVMAVEESESPATTTHLMEEVCGIRQLGVPCVVDRLIQQALLQVLQKRWAPTFSEHSYGFRPGRFARQAVAQVQRYVAEGYSVVVDLDLERFFDRVNQDGLMRGSRHGWPISACSNSSGRIPAPG